MEPLKSFPPIVSAQSSILILGSMPSDTSLQKQEYYGHPTNAFWPIMEQLCGYHLDTYEDKCTMIIKHRLALWDVLSSCKRMGSADQAIQEGVPNDILGFLALHEGIRCILCNGATAMRLFMRYLKRNVAGAAPYVPTILQAPSTSAAYTLPITEKASIWLGMISTGMQRS